MTIPVTAGIIKKDDKILIARRAAHKILGGYWEFPGGKIELNETPEECLAREIFEELKIRIEVNTLFHENEYKYETVTILLKSYLCTYASGKINLIDHSEFVWIDISDLNKFIFAPADYPIVDLLTLIHL